ncbi:MAG: hypothetical protein NTW19_03210 [Planctomycetota bacterium]|nr:hypothetical protein [Planctomycetota bacterium]
MPFQSGRVSFCRFRVEGDGPKTADATTLATLAEHSFRESEIGAPDIVESGWITGEHLLDTQFSYEKNGYGAGGTMLLFALRIDTHSVPAELKHAYKRMNEQALAAENPSGFASKAQKREAADTAARQVHEDLASGKYRRSKSVAILWDLPNGMLYCGASGNTVTEELAANFLKSFNLRLEALSAGSVAGRMLRDTGKGRDYEDLHPSAFTKPPEGGHDEEGESGEEPSATSRAMPVVPWVASSIDLKDFLGNEFLIWLWWVTETAEGLVEAPSATGRGKVDIAIAFDKTLDAECAWGLLGKQSLKAEGPTRLAEAGRALMNGKWPRKAGLILADSTGGRQWEITLQGDRWLVSGAMLPEVPEAQSTRELIEARLDLTRGLAETLDALYGVFLKARVSGSWASQRTAIRKWIRERQGEGK